MSQNIPVVILAGGLGMRMRDHSDKIPKALVKIGGLPIIHHVMEIYSSQGYNNFVACLGYKGEMIKDYFCNLPSNSKELVAESLQKNKKTLTKKLDDFSVTFVDTGIETQTGGRIKKIENYLEADTFFATYCDGLANIDLGALLKHHRSKGKVGTLTAINPISPFGIVEVNNGLVKSFKEKPYLPGFINGGFFAFEKEIFNYLDEKSTLEEEPMRKLAQEEELAAYKHEKFWSCMDTQKDVQRLNEVWEKGWMPHSGVKFGKAPWKIR